MSESEEYIDTLRVQHLELMQEVKRLNTSMESMSAALQILHSAAQTQTQIWDNQMKAVSSGLKALYLVWASIAFLSITTWLFYEGRISEWVWGAMNLVIMTPFFGEGIRVVLPIFGKENTKHGL